MVKDLAQEQIEEGLRREMFAFDSADFAPHIGVNEFVDNGAAEFVDYRGAQVEVTDPVLTPQQQRMVEEQLADNYWPIETLIRRINTETFEDVAQEIFDEAFNLLVERQKKYGPKNIEQQGLYGLLVRMRDDKLSRIQRALNGRIAFGEIVLDDIDMGGEEGDTLQDAYLDLANYAVISLIVLRGKWGKPLAADAGFDQ